MGDFPLFLPLANDKQMDFCWDFKKPSPHQQTGKAESCKKSTKHSDSNFYYHTPSGMCVG